MSKLQSLEMLENNVLINILPNKGQSKAYLGDHCFYVPKQYTISHLRAYLNDKFFSSESKQEKSYFLFAYGCILNNHERLGVIYERFKDKIRNDEDGLEIRYA